MRKESLFIPICLSLFTGLTASLIYLKNKNKNIKKEEIKEEPEIVYLVLEDDGKIIHGVTKEELDSYKTEEIPYREFYKIPVLKRNSTIDTALIDKKKVIFKAENGKINCYLKIDDTEEYFGMFNDKELTLYLTANEKCLETDIINVIFLPEGERFIKVVVEKVI